MPRGLSFSTDKKKQKRLWPLAAFLIMVAALWCIAIFMAVQAMAAPEDPAAEAAMKENLSGNQIIYDVIETVPEIPVIVIDPGHGGADRGCFKDGVDEKDINLSIAKKAKEELLDLGFQVVLTREDDTYIAKEDRVQMANTIGADLYISIHQNSYEEESVRGIETWYDGSDLSRDSKRLAGLVHRQTLRATDAAARELRDNADFHVTGSTKMAACLIETGFLSNKKDRELLLTEEYQEKLAAGIADAVYLYYNPKTMYLTFDDGPTAENTEAVLDILKARNIKAAFFVIGENVKKNPEVARRIVAEGHTIGIHCNSHDYQQIYQSADSYIEDFEKAWQAVFEVTGVEARIFRFPGGSDNAYNKDVREEIIEELTARGFLYYDWNTSLEDSLGRYGPEELVANARQSTLGRKKIILLAHDIVSSTVLCLEDLIDEFPDYQMELLTEEVEPIQF